MSSFIDRSQVIKFRRIKKKQLTSLPTTNNQLQIIQSIHKRNIQRPIYLTFHENKIKKQTDTLSTYIHKLNVLEDTLRSLKEVSRLFDKEYLKAFSVLQKLRMETKSLYKMNKYTKEYCDKHRRIDIEKEKIEKEIKINEKEQRNIEYSILFTKEAIQLHQFICQTKIEIDTSKSNSIIDLHHIQKLPNELICIIREYIPYDVRLQVIETKTNIYKLCSKMPNRNAILNHMIQTPDFHIYLHSHPLYEILTRPMSSNENSRERNIIKSPNSQFNIRFESIFLFIKQQFPRQAIQFITSLPIENK
jgi:hypothetical protein